jgi:hypothetical protein
MSELADTQEGMAEQIPFRGKTSMLETRDDNQPRQRAASNSWNTPSNDKNFVLCTLCKKINFFKTGDKYVTCVTFACNNFISIR